MGKRKHKARQKFLDSLTEEEKIKKRYVGIFARKRRKESLM